MDVFNIIRDHLIKNGYDGLFQPDECCCTLDDLAPCGQFETDCYPGFKGPCTCGEGCDFHIYDSKGDVEQAIKDAKDE